MYILFYTDSENGAVRKSEHTTIQNAFNNKRVIEKTGELTLVANKCFMSGIRELEILMLLHSHGELKFERLLNLIDRIEEVEKSL